MILKVAILLIVGVVVLSEKAGREDWLDPNDMLNFDPATGTMRNKQKVKETPESKPDPQAQQPSSTPTPTPSADEKPTGSSCKCPPQTACKGEQAALPLTRQYVKSLLEHLHGQMPHGQSEDYNMYITLSHDHVQMLKNFVLTGNQRHIHDVNDILTGMVNRVISSRMGRIEKFIEWVESKIGISLHRVLQVLMIGGLASLILVIEVKLQIHWRRRLWQLIILMFIISIPWTWYELLKQAEIKQQSFAMKDVPADCRNGTVDYWSTIKSYFMLQDDKCHAYYEHLMIDPIIKVPPTKAIAVTFVRFFLAPLKDIGTAVSEFIRALLIDLPLTLYPVAIAIVAVFSFMFLFMWFGYSIRLPFFLTIERPAQLSVADSRLNEALTDSSQQIMKQLEALQNRLESSEANMADKLRHLEQAQQLAIEYSMSSGQDSPQPAPTIHRSKSDSCQPSKIPLQVPASPSYGPPTVTLAAGGTSLSGSRNPPVMVKGGSNDDKDGFSAEAVDENDSFLVVDNENKGHENNMVDSESDNHENFVVDSENQGLRVDTLTAACVSNSERDS